MAALAPSYPRNSVDTCVPVICTVLTFFDIGMLSILSLAEIRNRFDLPKSTAWRLVKRLEREELVHVVKFGNQNLVRCALKGEK